MWVLGNDMWLTLYFCWAVLAYTLDQILPYRGFQRMTASPLGLSAAQPTSTVTSALPFLFFVYSLLLTNSCPLLSWRDFGES